MPITYEELEGSPSIIMDREGGSARRVFKVAWSDIGRAITEIFPGAAFGYPYTASVPGFPWLRASRMDIAPWNPEGMTGNFESMNTYPSGARISVDYVPFKWPETDATEGPAGANSDIQDITFLEHKVNFGGEYLTLPNNGVRWDQDPAGENTFTPQAGKYDTTQADKNFRVFEDVNVGITIPTIEHALTWHYVRRPPWTGIRNCLGKVNSEIHMNTAPETLLFTGASAERSYSTAGIPTWKLEYRISERCLNYPLRGLFRAANFTVVAGGTGYQVGDRLVFTGGQGKPTKVLVTAIGGAGAITAVGLATRGSYYITPTMPNTVGSETGSGSGATITAKMVRYSTEPAQGWNHFMRPETGRFEKMVRKDGSSVYRGVRFRQLYGGAP